MASSHHTKKRAVHHTKKGLLKAHNSHPARKKKNTAKARHTTRKQKLDLNTRAFWTRFKTLFSKFKRTHKRTGSYPNLEKIYEQDSPHRKKQKIDANTNDGYIEYQEFKKKLKKV